MTAAMQVGETARDRADFCRCFKTGAAVFLDDDGVVAHSTYRNTPSEPCAPARTHCDTRGCAPLSGKTVRFGSIASVCRCADHFRSSPAGSTSRRNTGVKSLCWGFQIARSHVVARLAHLLTA